MAKQRMAEGPVALTEANKLYFYKLLGEALGVGRQAFLPRALEALEASDLTPEKLGYEDGRALFEKLADVCQLTAFKGGRFYVTVQRNEAWDAALAAAENSKRPTGGKGKPWKRKKGALKPVRPRTIQVAKPAEPEAVAEPAAADAAPMEVAADGTAQAGAQTDRQVPPAGAAPAEQPARDEASVSEPTPQTEGAAQAEASPADAAGQASAPTAEAPKPARKLTLLEQIEAQLPKSADEEEAGATQLAPATPQGVAPEAQPAAMTEPAAASASQAAPQPVVASHVAPAQQPAGAPQPAAPAAPAPEPEPQSAAQPAPEAQPATQPAASPIPAAAFAPAPQPDPRPARREHDDFPTSFADEVSIKPALLGLLTRILPFDADLMSVLDEDWRCARATGATSGSRSRVTFPLRYLQEDGSAPISVTIRRNTRPGNSRRWQLALVDGDDGTGSAHEAAGLEGLPQEASGYWEDLFPRQAGEEPKDPMRELAQFVAIGSWETFLGTMATAAAPERWNYPGEGVGKASRYGILREYLAATLARVRTTDALAVSADGSLAAFDTGLLSPMCERLFAVLEPTGTDIPWRFAGLAEGGSGELGARLAATLPELPQQPAYLEALDDVRPRPDALVIPDYRALLGRALKNLPRGFVAAQLEGEEALLSALDDATTPAAHTQALTALSRAISAEPGRHRRACRALDDAIDLSLRRARQSYRHVAPAYDAARNRMLLLLPLALVDDARTDCALALELMPSGAYQAASALTLPRAYAAARTVSAELPSWLSAEDVLG